MACVFCAMQDWKASRREVYLAGEKCFMRKPEKVAALLDAEKYHEDWPLIPLEELKASSVPLPHKGVDNKPTTTLVLMHKRRVSAAALRGDEPVHVCSLCHEAFEKSNPQLSNCCLANWMWLGRHPPLLRESTLGEQLLLALGRVVSTKVYLSSKGKDEAVRQGAMTWRQKFLQQGMQGTAIVFGNGSVDDAMRSFPPTPEVLQDSFAAVFTGPESPTREEAVAMEGKTEEARKRREQMVRDALRKEVELTVLKARFDEQARLLIATNYVYNGAEYRTDLVERLPSEQEVPEMFQACAQFIAVDASTPDISKAEGPATSTTAAQLERDASDIVEESGTVPWLSVLEDDQTQTSELSKLPALQGLLEKMEHQAARVVANEVQALVSEGGYGALDDLGRESSNRYAGTSMNRTRPSTETRN